MSDIKPCPFCGSENIIISTVDDESKSGWDSVECGYCGVECYGFTVDDWNNRATDKKGSEKPDKL